MSFIFQVGYCRYFVILWTFCSCNFSPSLFPILGPPCRATSNTNIYIVLWPNKTGLLLLVCVSLSLYCHCCCCCWVYYRPIPGQAGYWLLRMSITQTHNETITYGQKDRPRNDTRSCMSDNRGTGCISLICLYAIIAILFWYECLIRSWAGL